MVRFYIALVACLVCRLANPQVYAQARPHTKATATKTVVKQVSTKSNGAATKTAVLIPSVALPYDLVKIDDLFLSNGERERVNRLVKGSRFLVVFPEDKIAELLFRKSAADSLWERIGLHLPDHAPGDSANKINWRAGLLVVVPDTCDMNQQGFPEILLTIAGEIHGAGTGAVRSYFAAVNLISVDDHPRLLLTALSEKTHSSESNSDGTGRPSTQGWRRKFKLAQELRIGKTEALEGGSDEYGITPFKPGRYRYLAGHLVWVGK